MAQLNVSIPTPLRLRLIKHCSDQGVSQGELVRKLITAHLGVELDRIDKLENRLTAVEVKVGFEPYL
tara:strand:- start:1696 stop:1896 length:201 start_codon:yes stop_codon:yes gene_type:complete